MLAATLTLATLALASPAAIPGANLQGEGAPQYPTTLKSGALKKLQKRLSDMLEQRDRLDSMELGDPSREGIRDRLGKARASFRAEWDKADRDGELLGSIGDLRAIFRSAYPFEKQRGKGRMTKEELSGIEFGLMVPKKYDEDEPTPMVLAVPGLVEGEWQDPDDHFESTWEDSEFAKTGIVVVPKVTEGSELDPMPDLSDSAGVGREMKLVRTAFAGLYHVLKNYRIDRDRLFLDCGKGSCAYGLRMLTYTPRYFAGAVLREPKDIEGMRLGSLYGSKLLLLQSDANKAEVAKLKERLDAVDPSIATVLEVSGEAADKDTQKGIDEWIAGVYRNLYQSKVIVEPNYDTFKDAYWAYIDVAARIESMPDGKKPRLEVVADKETNRITVKATSVESFYLMLNDALIDLSKEFTVEINGVATTHTFQRSINNLIKWSGDETPVGDPTFLFPVKFAAAVPKVEDEDSGGTGGE